MIHVTLKDGSVKEFENGISVMEIVKGLGAGLYKAACACKVNGELCDLRTVLNEDCALEVLTFDERRGPTRLQPHCLPCAGTGCQAPLPQRQAGHRPGHCRRLLL